MKNKTLKYALLCAVSLLVLGLMSAYFTANRGTDMLMPASDLMEGMNLWYVLAAYLAAELLLVKALLKPDWLRAGAVTCVMNAFTAVLALATYLIVGFAVELILGPIPVGSYHISHWVADLIALALANAAIEALVVKVGFKLPFKKLYWPLALANLVSLVICFACNLCTWAPHIHF